MSNGQFVMGNTMIENQDAITHYKLPITSLNSQQILRGIKILHVLSLVSQNKNFQHANN